MEWIEVTGRTVADASAAAAEQLGVSLDDAEVEVIEEERWGLFGRLRQEARVRARVRPAVPRPRQERRRRGARRPKADQAERHEDGERAEAPVVGESHGAADGRTNGADALPWSPSDQPVRKAGRPKVATGVGGLATSEGGVRGDESGAEARGTAASRPRRRRRGAGATGREAEAGAGPSPVATQVAGQGAKVTRDSSAPRREEDGVTVEQDRAAVTAAAIGFMHGLLDALGLEAEVTAREDDGALLVEVEGRGLGVLVGPKGATLAAAQELLRAALRRQLEGEVGLVYLDVAQYRRRRREALERFAQSVAAEVVRTGEPRALEPMSAADRRIVHTALLSVPGVATRSDGEEPLRRVVVFREPTPASRAE